jgi:hypothetical protein
MFDVVADVAEAMSLSFRTVEKSAASLNLALALTPSNYLKLLPVVPVLCVMKIAQPHLYKKAKLSSLSLNEVEEGLSFDRWPTRGEVRKEFIHGWWIYCLAEDLGKHPEIDVRQYANSLIRYSLDADERRQIVSIMANSVVDRFTLPPANSA